MPVSAPLVVALAVAGVAGAAALGFLAFGPSDGTALEAAAAHSSATSTAPVPIPEPVQDTLDDVGGPVDDLAGSLTGTGTSGPIPTLPVPA